MNSKVMNTKVIRSVMRQLREQKKCMSLQILLNTKLSDIMRDIIDDLSVPDLTVGEFVYKVVLQQHLKRRVRD